jgi:hypothetical protein
MPHAKTVGWIRHGAFGTITEPLEKSEMPCGVVYSKTTFRDPLDRVEEFRFLVSNSKMTYDQDALRDR